ncbi:MAG: DNA translocase FtsK 4TM domain-containing protein, partial [Kiritimatiellia bacterium]
MAVTKNEKSASRGIWGIVLFLSGVLLALSIFSYEWTDIGCLAVPPNTPVHNWIGPVGAWAAFLLFVLFGVIAYAIPFWCLAAGVLLLVSHQRRVNARRPLAASLVLLLALAVFVDLAGSGWTFPQRALNLADLCGLLGRLITRGLLVRWLSIAGATIVAGSGLVAAFIALVGSNISMRACRGLAVLSESLWQKAWNVVVARRERRRSEIQDRRKADEERLRIERTLKAAAQPAQAEKTETTGGTAAEQEAIPPTLVLPERKTTAPRRRVAADLADSKPESKPSVEKTEESATGTSYQLPPLSLLQPVSSGSSTALKTDTATTSRILVETLADFGIECEVTNVEQGPVVTRYELLPAPGIRIERISGLSNNLALALKATSVRVQTPIPGKGVVGVEVPNSTATVVYLRDILSGSRWNSSECKIPLAVGKDVGGVDLVADLTEMPHLLIAGATGSGKTVCLNAILAGLLLSRKPSELRLMLVDPKIVEFSMYEHLPHLVVPVITDAKKVPIALRWAINEMERRYKLFARVGVRN